MKNIAPQHMARYFSRKLASSSLTGEEYIASFNCSSYLCALAVARTRVQDDRGTSVTRTVEVHHAAAHIQQLALDRMKAPVVGFGDVLVEKSCHKDDEQEYEQCQNNSSEQ